MRGYRTTTPRLSWREAARNSENSWKKGGIWMKAERLWEALGEVGDSYIEEILVQTDKKK